MVLKEQHDKFKQEKQQTEYAFETTSPFFVSNGQCHPFAEPI